MERDVNQEMEHIKYIISKLLKKTGGELNGFLRKNNDIEDSNNSFLTKEKAINLVNELKGDVTNDLDNLEKFSNSLGQDPQFYLSTLNTLNNIENTLNNDISNNLIEILDLSNNLESLKNQILNFDISNISSEEELENLINEKINNLQEEVDSDISNTYQTLDTESQNIYNNFTTVFSQLTNVLEVNALNMDNCNNYIDTDLNSIINTLLNGVDISKGIIQSDTLNIDNSLNIYKSQLNDISNIVTNNINKQTLLNQEIITISNELFGFNTSLDTSLNEIIENDVSYDSILTNKLDNSKTEITTQKDNKINEVNNSLTSKINELVELIDVVENSIGLSFTNENFNLSNLDISLNEKIVEVTNKINDLINDDTKIFGFLNNIDNIKKEVTNFTNKINDLSNNFLNISYLEGLKETLIGWRIENVFDLSFNDSINNNIVFSKDKEFLIIGLPSFDNNRGKVEIYIKNTNNIYELNSNNFVGDNENDLFGTSVDISEDKNTIVIGAPQTGTNRGYIKSYRKINNGWLSLFNPITGDIDGSRMGTIVKINQDGSKILASAPNYSFDNINNKGRIYVLNVNGFNSWNVKYNIEGANDNDYMGSYLFTNSSLDIFYIKMTNNIIYYQETNNQVVLIQSINLNTSSFNFNTSQDFSKLLISYQNPTTNNKELLIYKKDGSTFTKLNNDIITSVLIDGGLSISNNTKNILVSTLGNNSSTFYYQFNDFNNQYVLINTENAGQNEQLGQYTNYDNDNNKYLISSYDSTQNKLFFQNREYSGIIDLQFKKLVEKANEIETEIAKINIPTLEQDISNILINIDDKRYDVSQNIRTIEQVFPSIENGLFDWSLTSSYINGDNSNDNLGNAVAISKDGLTIIVGAYLSDANGTNSGIAKVYSWDSYALNWFQKGNTILGKNSNDYMGMSVSINKDGTIIAIGGDQYFDKFSNGIVVVYEWNNNSWNQRGNDLLGNDNLEKFGSSVALNDNGNILVVGANNTEKFENNKNVHGEVNVFEWNNSSWVQKGTNINQNNPIAYTGTSVAVNSEGTIIAFGAPERNIDVFNSKGFIGVYEWNNNNNDWQQKGTNIYGDNISDLFGTSVSLSDNGLTVIGGAIENDDNGNKSGSASVYYWNNTTWIKKGNSIKGIDAEDYAGMSVSMNNDGNIIGIGAPQSISTNGDKGYVNVYLWTGLAWRSYGSKISGLQNFDNFGSSICLDSTGKKIVVGSPLNDVSANNSGSVGVFYIESYINKLKNFDSDFETKFTDISNTLNTVIIDTQNSANLVKQEKDKINVDLSNISTREDNIKQYIPDLSNSIKEIRSNSTLKLESLNLYINNSVVFTNRPRITGTETNKIGYSISTNFDGSTIGIVGKDISNNYFVNVYQQEGSFLELKQIGTTFVNAQTVKFSNDGKTMLLGFPNTTNTLGNKIGSVIAYTWNPGWVQKGTEIFGHEDYLYGGHNIEMNGDGTIIFFNSYTGTNSSNDSSLLQIYEFDLIKEEWVSRKTPIKNTHLVTNDNISSFSIDNTGNKIAFSFHNNPFKLYEWGNTNLVNNLYWLPISLTPNNIITEKVVLSSNADNILLASPNDSNNEKNNNGKVMLYKIDTNGNLSLKGDIIYGSSSNDKLGSFVDINFDMTQIILGTNYREINNINDGIFYLYDFRNNNWILNNNEIINTAQFKFGDKSNLEYHATSVALSKNSTNFYLANLNWENGIVIHFYSEPRDQSLTSQYNSILNSGTYLNNLINDSSNISQEALDSTNDVVGVSDRLNTIRDNFISLYLENLPKNIKYGFKASFNNIINFSNLTNDSYIGKISNENSIDNVSIIKLNDSNQFIQKGNNLSVLENDKIHKLRISNNSSNVILVIKNMVSNEFRIRIYSFINSEWTIIGNEIKLDSKNISYIDADINNDGNRIIFTNGPNEVSIYQFSHSENLWWKNGRLTGEKENDLFGYQVRINDSGNKIYISAPQIIKPFNENNGYVKSYIFKNGLNEWVQYGNTIYADSKNCFFGASISIENYYNKEMIAIGIPFENPNYKGKVKIYKLVNNNWTIENILYGTNENDFFGTKVELNKFKLVVSVPKFNFETNTYSSTDNYGEIKIYNWNSKNWVNYYSMESIIKNNFFGKNVSINENIIYVLENNEIDIFKLTNIISAEIENFNYEKKKINKDFNEKYTELEDLLRRRKIDDKIYIPKWNMEYINNIFGELTSANLFEPSTKIIEIFKSIKSNNELIIVYVDKIEILEINFDNWKHKIKYSINNLNEIYKARLSSDQEYLVTANLINNQENIRIFKYNNEKNKYILVFNTLLDILKDHKKIIHFPLTVQTSKTTYTIGEGSQQTFRYGINDICNLSDGKIAFSVKMFSLHLNSYIPILNGNIIESLSLLRYYKRANLIDDFDKEGGWPNNSDFTNLEDYNIHPGSPNANITLDTIDRYRDLKFKENYYTDESCIFIIDINKLEINKVINVPLQRLILGMDIHNGYDKELSTSNHIYNFSLADYKVFLDNSKWEDSNKYHKFYGYLNTNRILSFDFGSYFTNRDLTKLNRSFPYNVTTTNLFFGSTNVKNDGHLLGNEDNIITFGSSLNFTNVNNNKILTIGADKYIGIYDIDKEVLVAKNILDIAHNEKNDDGYIQYTNPYVNYRIDTAHFHPFGEISRLALVSLRAQALIALVVTIAVFYLSAFAGQGVTLLVNKVLTKTLMRSLLKGSINFLLSSKIKYAIVKGAWSGLNFLLEQTTGRSLSEYIFGAVSSAIVNLYEAINFSFKAIGSGVLNSNKPYDAHFSFKSFSDMGMNNSTPLIYTYDTVDLELIQHYVVEPIIINSYMKPGLLRNNKPPNALEKEFLESHQSFKGINAFTQFKNMQVGMMRDGYEWLDYTEHELNQFTPFIKGYYNIKSNIWSRKNQVNSFYINNMGNKIALKDDFIFVSNTFEYRENGNDKFYPDFLHGIKVLKFGDIPSSVEEAQNYLANIMVVYKFNLIYNSNNILKYIRITGGSVDYLESDSFLIKEENEKLSNNNTSDQWISDAGIVPFFNKRYAIIFGTGLYHSNPIGLNHGNMIISNNFFGLNPEDIFYNNKNTFNHSILFSEAINLRDLVNVAIPGNYREDSGQTLKVRLTEREELISGHGEYIGVNLMENYDDMDWQTMYQHFYWFKNDSDPRYRDSNFSNGYLGWKYPLLNHGGTYFDTKSRLHSLNNGESISFVTPFLTKLVLGHYVPYRSNDWNYLHDDRHEDFKDWIDDTKDFHIDFPPRELYPYNTSTGDCLHLYLVVLDFPNRVAIDAGLLDENTDVFVWVAHLQVNLVHVYMQKFRTSKEEVYRYLHETSHVIVTEDYIYLYCSMYTDWVATNYYGHGKIIKYRRSNARKLEVVYQTWEPLFNEIAPNQWSLGDRCRDFHYNRERKLIYLLIQRPEINAVQLNIIDDTSNTYEQMGFVIGPNVGADYRFFYDTQSNYGSSNSYFFVRSPSNGLMINKLKKMNINAYKAISFEDIDNDIESKFPNFDIRESHCEIVMSNNKINIFGYVFYNNIYSIYHKNYDLNTKIINEPNTLNLTIGGNNFIRNIFFTSQGCFFYTHGYGFFGQTRYINIKKFGTSDYLNYHNLQQNFINKIGNVNLEIIEELNKSYLLIKPSIDFTSYKLEITDNLLNSEINNIEFEGGRFARNDLLTITTFENFTIFLNKFSNIIKVSLNEDDYKSISSLSRLFNFKTNTDLILHQYQNFNATTTTFFDFSGIFKFYIYFDTELSIYYLVAEFPNGTKHYCLAN